MMEGLYEKHGKLKVYLVLALILIIINILTMVITHQVKISFSIQGQRFKYVSKTDNEILFADSEGNNASVTIDKQPDQIPTHFSIARRYQIEYKDKIIKCDSTDWTKGSEVITLSDGTVYTHQFISIEVDNNGEPKLPFEIQLVEQINNVYKYIKGGVFTWLLIFTIPMILLGLRGFVYPEKVWRVQHMLTVSGGEPTDFALSANKIVGIFIIVFALLLPVFAG